MLLLHDALRVSWPNWPVQLFGVLALLLPLTRRDRWPDPSFRLGYLASLLVFVVIFKPSGGASFVHHRIGRSGDLVRVVCP